MTERVLQQVLCIWHTDKKHPPEATLMLSGNIDKGLLTCRGCKTTFLMSGGIPILLEDKRLSRTERAELEELRTRALDEN